MSAITDELARKLESKNAILLAALKRIRALDTNTHETLRWDLTAAIADEAIAKAEAA